VLNFPIKYASDGAPNGRVRSTKDFARSVAATGWKVAVCGPHPAAVVALGPQYSAIWKPKDADFAMTLGEFYCAKLDAPVLFEIKREGVVYARVYDIRGRSIPSLLNVRGPDAGPDD
jgi:hypothetical protein